MAVFDLKDAAMYIRDGFADTGAVNNASGYTAGATTMLVDGIVGQIYKWSRFTVAGDTVVHTVTATVETSSNTTSLTFTPALGDAVVDNAVITFLPNQIELVLGEGNLSYTEKKPREYKKNKGRLYSTRNGDEEPVEVSLSCYWEFLKSSVADGDIITFEEALKKTGQAANWVTSDSADPCAPYSVDIIIIYTPPCTDKDNEVITLSKFRYEELAHSAKDGTIEVKGMCNITAPTIVRGGT